LLAECVQQAGWPDGGLNVLPLSNDDASLLVTDERIKLISFTGSVPVGWDIKRRAGKKKVVLELGGNAGSSCTATPISLRRGALRCRRLWLCRPDLHFGAAHSGGALGLRQIHRSCLSKA
jgi:hypothetical protein